MLPNRQDVDTRCHLEDLPEAMDNWDTHTHTHTYIYIYIYMRKISVKVDKPEIDNVFSNDMPSLPHFHTSTRFSLFFFSFRF